MVKICTKCHIEKNLTDFHKSKGSKDGYHTRCKLCRIQQITAYNTENKELINLYRRKKYVPKPEKPRKKRVKTGNPPLHSSRELQLLFKYGITLVQYQDLLNRQNNVCAACEKSETRKRNGKICALCVDHDHTCCPGVKSCGKCIRGLLCARCNIEIGFYEKMRPESKKYLLKTSKKGKLN